MAQNLSLNVFILTVKALNTKQRLQPREMLLAIILISSFQVIIDYHAYIEYLAKYASKGEPRSPIIQNCRSDSSATKLTKKVIMKSLGERDFSAQETMHHLMSLKLVSSSFNATPVKNKKDPHLSVHITAKDRANQYPGVFHTDNGLLFCSMCNVVLDHVRKNRSLISSLNLPHIKRKTTRQRTMASSKQ